MQTRIDLKRMNPKVMQQLLALQDTVEHSGLEPALLQLVVMRASQLNGCAYCIDMHSKDARAAGESEQRLYALDAWRETPFYTDRERAALEWTESVTLLREGHVPDGVYRSTRVHFTEDELMNLTLAIAMINVWNRLCVPFRAVAGTYTPGMHRKSAAAPAQLSS